MNRAKAIATIVRKSTHTMLFQNLQANGFKSPHPLTAPCFTLTAAMGLGVANTSNCKGIRLKKYNYMKKKLTPPTAPTTEATHPLLVGRNDAHPLSTLSSCVQGAKAQSQGATIHTTRDIHRHHRHHTEIRLAHRRPGKQPVVFACIGAPGATEQGE